MRTFEFESLDSGYPILLKALLDEGEYVSPRGMLTKEISPVSITITNPKKRVISHPVRKLNYGFMIAEALWYLSGTDDLEMVAHYNSQWRNYSDDGETLNGAYGKRIFNYPSLNGTINQFETVIDKLKKDKDSRHGTVLIFRPEDLIKETKDVPCNNLLRFSIRKNKLNMMNVIRSNDIIFGLPYDMHFFMLLQELMAARLGVELGTYTHVVDSLHLYEMHFEMAEKIADIQHSDIYDYHQTLDYGLENWEDFSITLQTVLGLERMSRVASENLNLEKIHAIINVINNEGWKNYARVIASYNFKKVKNYEAANALLDEITNEFKGLCGWRK